MKTRSLRFAFSIAAIFFIACLAGCGTGGLPHSNQVTVTVTPSQATISTGGTLALTGSADGFTASPIFEWWIQESKDLDFNNDCGFLSSQAPPQTGCPFGYVMYDLATASHATYYAPPVAGTYHATFSASQFIEFDHLTKNAEATITVQ